MPAYATVHDLIEKFGETEIIRLTVPSGQDMDAVNVPKAEAALVEVSATIDSYLRRRYTVPLDVVPDEIRGAACKLARYELMCGEDKIPSDQVRANRDEVVRWLKEISLGQVLLDLTEVETGDQSFAQVSVRGDHSGVSIP